MSFNVYLFFNGNCEEAMNFYKDAAGGVIESINRFGDSPMPTSEDAKNKVIHAIMDIGGSKVMFSDCGDNRSVNFGDNFSLSLSFNSDESITACFNAVSAGGKVTMPLQDTFWGAKFGMCTDKFGINWMFNYDKPKGGE